jgi:Phosphotransferase enzyme family
LSSGVELARNLAADLRILPFLSKGRGTILRDRADFDLTAFVERLAQRESSPVEPGWEAQGMLPTLSDNVVMLVGPPREPPEVIVKVAGGPGGDLALEHEKGALSAFGGDTRLERLYGVLPVVRGEGVLDGRRYLVESVVPGVEADEALRRRVGTRQMLAAAASAIAAFHGATRSEAVALDDHALKRLVDDPVAVLEQVMAYRPRAGAHSEALARLADAAHRGIAGKAVARSWVHGDYVPANIFVTPDAGRVTGIVDWELADPDGLPQLDMVHLLLSTRVLVRRRELGQIVRELLIEPRLDDGERAALDLGWQGLPGDVLDLRSLILVCWLHVVSSTLVRADRYVRSRLWVKLNVEGVLRAAP